MSSFQRLKCIQEWYILGVGKGVRLEKYPQFRSVLIERGSTVHIRTLTLCDCLNLCVSDVDECVREGSSYPCHTRADCNNSMGSYYCTCQTGFSGDGSSCDGKTHKQLQMAILFDILQG